MHFIKLPNIMFYIFTILITGIFNFHHADAIETSLPTAVQAPILQVSVVKNKSLTFKFDKPFSTSIVGEPAIADVLPLSSEIFYILGKKIGNTNIVFFDEKKNLVGVIDVEVKLDAARIATEIKSGTHSPGIRVSVEGEQVVLSGEARDVVDAERALSIAKSMLTPAAGEDAGKYVIDAMKLSDTQQVLLQVRFIEVDRNAERDLGVNWYAGNSLRTGKNPNLTNGTGTYGDLPNNTITGTFSGSNIASPFGIGLINLAAGGANLEGLLTALEQKGLARKLAEPDLVALSGDKASFLAGGQYPVPTVQSNVGTTPLISTQYQPFGVELTFTPTVLPNGVINLKLAPRVSELDYTNGVFVNGTAIPSLTDRRAETTIELKDGQSFAIAGLLQSDSLRSTSQLPWLGSVPIIGALFRSSSYSQKESDLVVIVTPHLVAPVRPGQALATPLDGTIPGNDQDFFLMGNAEIADKSNGKQEATRRPAKRSGHIISLD